ncbi:hypothetical protein FHX73_14326 [Kitasatospora viridis]|uniref:Uncharacterized protein n=2 Tax=Kitasatospora viridis TaxID=281105 RepID=A0A561T6V6_9ACTN|nr:hypothetical protein FHX73_14326 [Kitasatospora viridis]
MLIGAALLAVALFLPVLSFRYAPPGGAGIVAGHSIKAFTDPITGWQLAQQSWSHIRLFFGFVIVRLLLPIAPGLAAQVRRKLQVSASYSHALVHILFVVALLAMIGLAVAVGTVVMPANGEAGIADSLHNTKSIIPGDSVPADANDPGTPYLAASLGAGFYFLAAGMLVSAVSMWRKVVLAFVALIAVIIVLSFIDGIAGARLNESFLHHLDGFR